MAAHDITIVGSTFSRLTVIGAPFKDGKRIGWYVMCRCECGSEKDAHCANLVSGHTRSCGCLANEEAAERMRVRKTTHGHTRDLNDGGRIGTPTYKSWRSAKDRCCNPKAPNYSEYGGRGITICDRWMKFENFLADMGNRPDGTTLDRYPDVNGNYEPSNCRWATPREQAANRRNSVWIEVDGAMRSTAEVASQIGIDPQLLRWRLNNGWSIERAISTPTRFKSPKSTP